MLHLKFAVSKIDSTASKVFKDEEQEQSENEDLKIFERIILLL